MSLGRVTSPPQISPSIESSERMHVRDQGNFGSPHTREIEESFRSSAGAVEDDYVLGVAGDLTGELVQLFRKGRA